MSNPLSDLLSAKCVNLFSDIPVFQNIGVYRLSDASDFVENNKNGLGITNEPMTLLFMAVPAINKNPSKVNAKSSRAVPAYQDYTVRAKVSEVVVAGASVKSAISEGYQTVYDKQVVSIV